MKVLYIVTGIAPRAGWGTEFIQNLIFALSRSGIEATIITPLFIHTPSNFNEWKKEIEVKYNVKIIIVKLPRFTKKSLCLQLYLSPIFVTLKVLSELKYQKYDLIHEFTSTPIILFRTLIIKLIYNLPSVLTLSVYNKTILGSLKWIKYLNLAKFYLIPSKKIVNELLQLNINPQKIIYSPPGVDLLKLTTNKNKTSVRHILKLPPTKFIITYYGTLTQEKGVKDLLKLANDLLETNYHDKIIITLFTIWRGGNELLDYPEIKNNKNIILRQELVNIPYLLKASDVLIFPQLTGHGTVIPPISIIEAASANKIVFAKNTPGVSDFLPEKNIFTQNNLLKKVLTSYKSPSRFRVNPNRILKYNINDSVNLHLNTYKKVYES